MPERMKVLKEYLIQEAIDKRIAEPDKALC
jgi:hypothetical protein